MEPPPPGPAKDNGSSSPDSRNDYLISTPLPAPSTKRRRTAASLADCCRTCRLRKVKCTGNPGNGPCSNCARLDLSCTFTDPDSPAESTAGKVSRTTPSHSHTEAGTLRKRAQRACNQCHTHKTKCSGDLPRCRRCEASDLVCEYTPAKRKFTNVSVTAKGYDQTSPQSGSSPPESASMAVANAGNNHVLSLDVASLTAEELLFRKDIIMKHMDAYFEYIYYMPCMGFFRRNTVYQEIQDGTFDPPTAAAMCAITSLFVNPCEAGRVFAMKCSDDVELHCFRGIFRFGEEDMILYALNCYHNFLHGHLAKVWQCFGLATRLMIGLQVNWDVRPRDRSFADQEKMRRIVWHFFYLDRLLAGGYDEYIGCRDEIMKIRLPCNEEAFNEDSPVVVERLHEKSAKSKASMGIHGYQLRLIDVKHRIMATTRKMGNGQVIQKCRLEPSKVMSYINGFQNELSQINASLPYYLRLGDEHIARAMSSEYATGYVFIHTCLSSVHIDLYSFSLPGLREQASLELLHKLPSEFVIKSRKQAVAHALCLGRFLQLLQRRLDEQPATDKLKLVGCSSMVKFTTQCIRVLLTALQHNLYRDMYEETTAPRWRVEPADEPHIRGLIDSLLQISKSWCQIIPRNQQTYERNKTAVEQFYRTRTYADQKPDGYLPMMQITGQTRLPGPQHILENVFVPPVEEPQERRANEAAEAARWFGAPQPGPKRSESAHEGFDVEYGPPGIPMFLAEAQGVSPTPTDDVDTLDATDDLLLIQSKMMQMPSINDLRPPPSDNSHVFKVDGPSSMEHYEANMNLFQSPLPQPIIPQPQARGSHHHHQPPPPPPLMGIYGGGQAAQYENDQKQPAYLHRGGY